MSKIRSRVLGFLVIGAMLLSPALSFAAGGGQGYKIENLIQ